MLNMTHPSSRCHAASESSHITADRDDVASRRPALLCSCWSKGRAGLCRWVPMVHVLRLVPRVIAAMPGGVALQPAVWDSRHRWIQRLLWFHLLPVTVMSLTGGFGVRHALIEAFPLAMLAYCAS